MPRSGEGIYRRGSSWWIDARIGGRRYIHRLGKGISRQAAKELATVFRTRVLRREAGIEGRRDLSFEKAVELFLDHSNANCGPHTVEDYRQSARQLAKTFAGKSLSQITVFAVEGYKRRRLEDGVHVRLNRELATLRRIFRVSKNLKRFDGESPFPTVKLLKEPQRRARFLDEDEERCLLAACDEQLRVICTLGIHCGLRIQREALTLRWGAVDLARGLLTVECAFSKSGKSRTMPLNSVAGEALRQHRLRVKDTSPDAYVFLNERGQPYARRRGIRKAFDTACRRAKIVGATPHTLRHTFASRLVMRGVDLRTVQELGGWASIGMVERYAHPSPEHKLEAVERLAQPGIISRRYADIGRVGSP